MFPLTDRGNWIKYGLMIRLAGAVYFANLNWAIPEAWYNNLRRVWGD